MNTLAEEIILNCIPGGDSCDPQLVADKIREYFKKKEDAQKCKDLNQKAIPAADWNGTNKTT